MELDNFNKLLLHKTVVVPDEVELFILGDIHGELDTLNKMLEMVNFKEGDYLFCCGDLIDRGTQNREVVDAFDTNKNWHTVLGNHDLFPIMEEFNLWVMNGGSWAVLDDTIYGEHGKYKVEQSFVEKLLKHPVLITIFHRGQKYGIVHAGFPDRGIIHDFMDNDWDRAEAALKTFGTQALELFVWDRATVGDAKAGLDVGYINNVSLVFSGHTVLKEPLMSGNRQYLDLGSHHYGTYAVYTSYTNKVEVIHARERV